MRLIEPVIPMIARRAPVREGRRCRMLLRKMLCPLKDVDGAAAADALINHFGSLRATLAASQVEQYRAINDRRVVSYLSTLRQSMRWVLRDEVEEKTLLAAPAALRSYLKFCHGSDAVEQLRVFYLDARGQLLREEAFDRGSPDQVVVCVGQVIGRSLTLGARMLIMVHNHPSGDPTPSNDDRAITRKIAIGAHAVGITLFDHLIVCEARDFSFREAGLL